MQTNRWHTAPIPYETIRKLADALDASDILATVLARRGYRDPDDAREFLFSDGSLHDPFRFPGMTAVCARINAAVAAGEQVCIHGDYDVDGITATALLKNVLQRLGARVDHHLPNRFTEGYGIAPAAIDSIADGGSTLLITVDCGIGAREQLEHAAELGMDTIVIDHHQPVEELIPEALIISPQLADYPFKELAGVGLAFKVAQALLAEEGSPSEPLPPMLQEQLDLVALGTIADVVPLLDENRSLVKRGLPQLARSRRPGLLALMKKALVEPSRVNTGTVAYRLAPRLNAAGRLEDPNISLELLLADSEEEATSIADRLESLNRERQKIENQMLAEAQEIVGNLPGDLRDARGYVLSSPGWHEGVIGIVASKMVEKHHRPVIMVAEGDTTGKGSGRSISAFDLHAALSELAPGLAAFGGHKAACGLTIEIDRLPEFQKAFAAYANERLEESDLQPSYYVDALVSGRELTLDLAEELSRMEPFGMGNPSIDLVAAGARMIGCRTTRDGRHLQCQVEAGGARAGAIGFGQGHLTEKINSTPKWDVVFRLEQNEYNGSVSPQLKLRDFFPHEHRPRTEVETCSARCSIDCPDRVCGDEFWSMVDGGAREPGSGLEQGATVDFDVTGLKERLIDRRNRGGIHGLVTMLASCGESILLLTADVARRRNLITEELSLARSNSTQILLGSSRCGQSFLDGIAGSLSQDNDAIMLADFTTAANYPAITGSFRHVVFVDPPLNRSLFTGVAAATKAYIHLFYCDDEVQFTQKVLEHEYQLRDPLKKVYRHLKAGNNNPLNEATERLLLSGGKYVRQPGLIARCLRVLSELGLIRFEEESADRVIVVPETAAGARLEDSATFRQADSYYKECAAFLSKSQNVKMI